MLPEGRQKSVWVWIGLRLLTSKLRREQRRIVVRKRGQKVLAAFFDRPPCRQGGSSRELVKWQPGGTDSSKTAGSQGIYGSERGHASVCRANRTNTEFLRVPF